MKRLIILFTVLIISMQFFAQAQSVGINSTGAMPNRTAILDVDATGKGILIPRMTKAVRDTITGVAEGLMIYQTDNTPGFYYYNGTAWLGVAKSTSVDSLRSTNDSLRTANNILETALLRSGAIVKDVDGNVYGTVRIGDQVWMAENLKVTHYKDGTPIPNVNDITWPVLSTGASCDYANSPANSAIYGKLYNFYAVSDPRGLAPAGWHVPTDAEWTTLTTYLGGEDVAGAKLRESGTAHWFSPNIISTNISGFTALPGGARMELGSYISIYISGMWWTSTEFNSTSAWLRETDREDSRINRSNTTDSGSKHPGFSIRCVKD